MSKINIKEIAKNIKDKQAKVSEETIEKKALLHDTLIASAAKRMSQGNLEAAENLVSHAVSKGEISRISNSIRDKAVRSIAGTDDFMTNLKTRSALVSAQNASIVAKASERSGKAELTKSLTEKAKKHIYDNILAKSN